MQNGLIQSAARINFTDHDSRFHVSFSTRLQIALATLKIHYDSSGLRTKSASSKTKRKKSMLKRFLEGYTGDSLVRFILLFFVSFTSKREKSGGKRI